MEPWFNRASVTWGASVLRFSWIGARNLEKPSYCNFCFDDVKGPDASPLRDLVGRGGISTLALGGFTVVSRSVTSELGSVLNFLCYRRSLRRLTYSQIESWLSLLTSCRFDCEVANWLLSI